MDASPMGPYFLCFEINDYTKIFSLKHASADIVMLDRFMFCSTNMMSASATKVCLLNVPNSNMMSMISLSFFLHLNDRNWRNLITVQTVQSFDELNGPVS